jgi:hypothetical protein
MALIKKLMALIIANESYKKRQFFCQNMSYKKEQMEY